MTETKTAPERRFNVLFRLGGFIQAIGVLGCVAGALMVIDAFFGQSAALGLLSGLGILACGFVVIAFGQFCQCIVAIEENTRRE